MNTQIQDLFDQYYTKITQTGFLPILDLVKATSEHAWGYAVGLLVMGGMAITVNTLRFFVYQQPYPLVETLDFPSYFQVNEQDLQVYNRLMVE